VQPPSLSGFVTQNGVAAAGVMMTLTFVDTNGNTISLYAVTDVNGFYSFNSLTAGTYTITATSASGEAEQISSITLATGVNGLFYNFDLSGNNTPPS
jgi:hypothetical protein